jgi:apolipoprotein N-acyltransferase
VIGRREALLVAGGAVLFLLAYPPFELLVPSFLAVVPAVWLIRGAEGGVRPEWEAWKRGFWFGLVLNLVTLYWLVVALWRFTSLSALGYLVTTVVLGMFVGIFFWAVVRVRRTWPVLPLAVVIPVCWTAGEWTVGHLPDVAFPWLGLGTSLAAFPVLAQTAELWGARGLTLFLVTANVLLADTFDPGEVSRRRRALGALAVAAGVVLAVAFSAWREHRLPLRTVGPVAMLQPNIGFSDKWDEGQQEVIVDRLLTMSERAIRSGRPALVLWPEAAAPGYLDHGRNWGQRIDQLARTAHTPILASGIDVQFDGPDDFIYFNAAFFVDSTGTRSADAVYRKRHLVPIVERVPFVNPAWFGGLRFFGGFGRGRRLPLFETTLGRFGVMICYESAFEGVARRYRATGADFLVNITNDAWYGRTAATYQHAAHLVLRAIETRAGVARAANSGISGFVDPLGRYHDATALETEALVIGSVTTSDVTTLYVRWGDWVGRFCVVISSLLVGGALVHAWRRGSLRGAA